MGLESRLLLHLLERMTVRMSSIVLLGVGVLAFSLVTIATLNVLKGGEPVGQVSASDLAIGSNSVGQHDHSQHSVSSNEPRSTRVAGISSKLFYAYNETLPPGYKCSGADGYVYKTSELPDGSTGIEILQRDGQMVRCGGDQQSSHRY